MPDVIFSNEYGADMGGPTKEYFHIAISSLTRMDPAFNIQLFGGKQGHFIPIYGVDAVASGCFEMVGKLVAHSVLHDGPGFIGLSPAVVEYLTTGSFEAAKEVVTTSDLLDIDVEILLDEKVCILFFFLCPRVISKVLYIKIFALVCECCCFVNIRMIRANVKCQL